MDLKITLEDERLCTACPFNITQKKCVGGFVREMAVLYDEARSEPPGIGKEATYMMYAPVRPQSCLLANERASTVVTKIKVKEAK